MMRDLIQLLTKVMTDNPTSLLYLRSNESIDIPISLAALKKCKLFKHIGGEENVKIPLCRYSTEQIRVFVRVLEGNKDVKDVRTKDFDVLLRLAEYVMTDMQVMRDLIKEYERRLRL